MNQTQVTKTSKTSVVTNVATKKAFLFGTGTLASRILGFLRDALIFSLMPLDTRDAWLSAFRLPNFFRRLLGEGGLSASFIPLYVKLTDRGERGQRQILINGIFTLLMGTALLICVLCFIFMDPLINFWLGGPGFKAVSGKLAMTVQMARIMVFFLIFVLIFAFFMALLNGLKKFTLTGFTPMLLNLSIITGLILFREKAGLIVASSWAVPVGGVLMAVALLPSVIRNGVLPRLSFKIGHPLVKKVIKKFLPTLVGVGVLQILTLVNLYFASQLSSGTVSYIYLGERLLELPLSLIAVSLGTTLLPSLSSHWSRNEKDFFIKNLSRHLELFYFLSVPSVFGFWFLGGDIVDILFSRGEFTGGEVPIVAGLLKIHCLTLLCSGSLKILNQAFYAIGETLTPALISLSGLIVHLFLAPRLMTAFAVDGIVLSTALVSFLNLILSFWFLQKKLGGFPWNSLVRHFCCCFLASLPMGGGLWLVSFHQWKQGRFVLDMGLLLALIASAGLVYFLCAGLLRMGKKTRKNQIRSA